MYRPQVLPPTGGGLIVGTTGLISGYFLGNWLIIGVSLLVMGIIVFCLIRLYRAEKNSKKLTNK